MPENENQKPETAETREVKAEKSPQPATSAEDSAGKLEASIQKCAKLGEATCKNPEEEEAFNQALSKYRLSPDMQKMAFNMFLASPGGDEAIKFFGEVSLVNTDKASAPLPENFNVESAKIDLNFSKVGQYFGYEKTPDGTTKVTVKIPGLQLSGLRSEEGQLGGAGKIEQAIGSGTLSGTVLYMEGKVTGIIDYKSPQAAAGVVINEDSVSYSATFNVAPKSNVAFYGNIAGQIPFEGDIQSPMASLGMKADFGKSGTLTAEAYARKNIIADEDTGDNKELQDFGATVAYEIPL